MEIKDKYFSITLQHNTLLIKNWSARGKLTMPWPGTAISLNGKSITPDSPLGPPELTRNTMSQSFENAGITFLVSMSLENRPWIRKRVRVTTKLKLPTPDYLEVHTQNVTGDCLEMRGYIPSGAGAAKKGQEEGAGIAPGCGYPLIGKQLFFGLEHPAAFNRVASRGKQQTVSLMHHPVWNSGELQAIDAVMGWSNSAEGTFAKYLESVRVPRLSLPLVSFCTFWTDRYLGDYEYDVSFDAYAKWFKAFKQLGLIPSIFTLDAGWHNRHSIFAAKKRVGGDRGLKKLNTLARGMGAELSLWVSHNGPMGIAPEYLEKRGIQTGGGNSSAYSGNDYGVMMDARLVNALEKRFVELASEAGVRHLKIDWDNECATNRSFDKVYPTVNHVRQASLNAFFRIADKRRAAVKGTAERLGTWPSPWWLMHSTHVCVSDGGDSEFAVLPSRTMRDAATTHRDLMYYNILRRDRTPMPLDCWDNHEFPDAFRNPFSDDPATWVNTCWMAFMRGTTYPTLKLMPESLEDWQAESFGRIMEFSRKHAKHIYVDRGRMILGHPGHGEIYGFLQNNPDNSWCILRNPLPVPQTVHLDPIDFSTHGVGSVMQFYPHYERLDTKAEITFLAHEVKVVIFAAGKHKWLFDEPHMIEKKRGGFAVRFPASRSINKSVSPMVHPMHRIDKLECMGFEHTPVPGGNDYKWTIRSHHRTRELECQLAFDTQGKRMPDISAFFSRYVDAHSGYNIPVAEIRSSPPGHGEKKNMDSVYTRPRVFYAVKIPDGGELTLRLTVRNAARGSRLVDAWVAGYEAPSRGFIERKRGPAFVSECLPVQHPLGFGHAIRLDTRMKAVDR